MRIRSTTPMVTLFFSACGGGLPSVRVPESVAASLPRESRILLRDAAQEVIIAQADLEDAVGEVARREREIEEAYSLRDRVPAAERALRDADVLLLRSRVAVAEAEVEVAERRLELAHARHDTTRAEVLLRHELVSSASARLRERQQRVRSAQADVDDAVAVSRKQRGSLDQAARRRDHLLDRYLTGTTNRPGMPWTD